MKIGMRYIKGFPSDEDLQKIHITLTNINIDFDTYDISEQAQNSSADLSALIALFISRDFYVSFASGLLSIPTYEAIKSVILYIWKKASNKYLTMKQSGNKISEKPIDIDIQLELVNSRKLSYVSD